ncbi:hypothetical protein JKP88DRAFT_266781 [Tribonema minus]|uniref:Uncharacterized protein n=1 Tax=Tribonema minus TaxID=303371 RepID=A0A835ZEP2_9STRA|nr:hypothetical protein JKP88DRAFT_266781 [Tribonema minus]
MADPFYNQAALDVPWYDQTYQGLPEHVEIYPTWLPEQHVDPWQETWQRCLREGTAFDQVRLLWTLGTRMWSNICQMRIDPLAAYTDAASEAASYTWKSLVGWLRLAHLILKPFIGIANAIGMEIWPFVRAAGVGLARWQVTRSLTFILLEAALIGAVVAMLLLRRYMIRNRLLPRAQSWIEAKRALVRQRHDSAKAAFQQLQRSVAKKSKLAAQMLPHMLYWAVAAAAALLLPAHMAALSLGPAWEFVTVGWPILTTIMLARGRKRSGASPSAALDEGVKGGARPSIRAGTPSGKGKRGAAAAAAAAAQVAKPKGEEEPGGRNVDEALMYWIVFALAQCCAYVLGLVPGVGRLVLSTGTGWGLQLRMWTMLAGIWLQLPGSAGGIHMAYALIEPLIHEYIRAVRPPGGADAVARSKNGLSFLVTLRILSQERASMIAENIADSWMLLPTPLLVFSPGFVVRGGCMYAGLLVPAINSAKALAHRNTLIDNSQGGARTRWLTYWAVFGMYWYFQIALASLLAWLPFANHAQLALLLWLQLPVFRGSYYVLAKIESALVAFSLGGTASPGAAARARGFFPASRTVSGTIAEPSAAAAPKATAAEAAGPDAKEALPVAAAAAAAYAPAEAKGDRGGGFEGVGRGSEPGWGEAPAQAMPSAPPRERGSVTASAQKRRSHGGRNFK